MPAYMMKSGNWAHGHTVQGQHALFWNLSKDFLAFGRRNKTTCRTGRRHREEKMRDAERVAMKRADEESRFVLTSADLLLVQMFGPVRK